MSIKDELIADEEIIFNVDDIAEEVIFTTVKNKVSFEKQLAIFNENNTGLIMQDGLESNKSESTISIPRSLYDKVVIVDPNLFGCRITRIKDQKVWEVQREIKKNGIIANLLCMRSTFNKGKAQ